MNAAAQRRLTPVVGTVVAVLGIVLLSLLFGLGHRVSWDPPRPPKPLPTARAVTLPAPPPLQSYAPVWLHPLFSADRKPIVTSGGTEGVSLNDLQLTGVILTTNLHMALLGPVNGKGGDEDKQVSVREGAMLPDSNWKLIQVLPRSAIFASPTGRTELKLPAGAPIDQMVPPNNGAPPMNAPRPVTPPPGRERSMEPEPPPPPPNNAQAQRLQKLRAAILKQRSQQQQNGNAQGDH
ncbi:general secretion pathway protein GspN [Dyella monticola]|uniref:General secretion pathway protein GspN n=1 Tax=Dyella monticola TaxID=1927958 RepID=A0A370WTE4_9GAMM|nr:general secretion pathway protein GspN [Dyella monticola]RDS79383.1 general secretion pathway protein GspN [Dyella monticola]